MSDISGEPCSCTVTHGRDGEKGSWCEKCGRKVWEVHDRPCGECVHFRMILGGGSCGHHLMRVSADMFVNYALEPRQGQSGLCFVAKETVENVPKTQP